MTDYYDTIRLRQIARFKLAKGLDLTEAEEFSLTDFVPAPVSEDRRIRDRQKPQYKEHKKRKWRVLDDKADEIDKMRRDGLSMGAIAKILGVSPATVHADLIRRNKNI